MSDLSIAANEGITTVTLRRGKVHPLNESYVIEIARCFEDLKTDTRTRAIILTGEGSFFSFGLDVPDLYSYSKDDFARFLRLFTKLYRDLYLYPKPIVAAINGHCIAGGTMLAMSCDCRLMVPGKAKISLNEITFGSSVFAGATAILRYLVGQSHAETILLSGDMYSAERALELGLIDGVVAADDLAGQAHDVAALLASKHGPAFAAIKGLLREPVVAGFADLEEESIQQFNAIWYSAVLRENLKGIKID